MILFLLGIITWWFIISVIIVVMDIDVLPIYFYRFITLPVSILILIISIPIFIIGFVIKGIVNLIQNILVIYFDNKE